jgi:ABC-type dipeptide/oligopeptide/nickel transport system permease subunit
MSLIAHEDPADAPQLVAESARLRDFWLRFRGNRNARAGAAIVGLVVFVACTARLVAPYSFSDTDLINSWMAPSTQHWLGTDNLGRDILSRILVGCQVSLTLAVTVLAITLAVGTALGIASAYLGGWLDSMVMRTADIIFAFPDLILAILLTAVLGSGVTTVMIALSLVYWPGIARLARSLVLTLRTELFVDAAIVAGTPTHRIMLRHLLPNIVAPLIVRASVGIGFVVTAEASLSFLGIGIQEPTPSLGGMIRDGLVGLRTDPYLALSSSVALAVMIIGFNLLGDGFRDILDPRIRER